MHKLTVPDKEALQELRQAEGVSALLKETENRVIGMERDVLTFSLDGKNDHELVARKLRAEGARKLFTEICKILQNIAK